MKRLALNIALSLLAIVLFVVAGLGILLSTFNPNDYKDKIAELAQKHTGLAIVFEGDLQTSIFPVLGLKTGAVRVTDEAIYGGEPFLEIQQSTLRLALMPLLLGRIEVQELLLDGAKIKLITTANGKQNWQRGTPTKAEQERSQKGIESLQAPSAPPPPADEKSLNLTIDALHITNLQVTYQDLGKNSNFLAQVSNLELTDLGRKDSGSIALQAILADKVSTLEASINLKSTVKVLDKGNFDLKNTQAASMAFDIANFDLELRNPAAPNNASPLQLKSSMDLTLNLAEGSIFLQNLKGTLQGKPFTGQTSLQASNGQDDAATTSKLEGNLSLEELDIDQILAFFAELESATTTDLPVNQPPSVVTSTINKPAKNGNPLANLGNTTANFVLNIGKMHLNKAQISNLQTTVVVAEGNLQVDSAFAVFGGKVQTTTNAKTNTPLMTGSVLLDIVDLQIGELLQTFTKQQKLSGLAQGKLNLNFQGNTNESIAKSLSGTANIDIRNGKFTGLNLSKYEIPGMAPLADTFSVESLTASAKINKGIATTNDINLVSKAMLATGNATIDIPENYLQGNASLRVAGKAPAIPLIFEGFFNEIIYSVDMKSINKQWLEQMLSPETGKILEEIGRNLKKR